MVRFASSFSRAARELIATVAPPYLINHSVRAYAWAVELARHDGLRFDPEMLAWGEDLLYARSGPLEGECVIERLGIDGDLPSSFDPLESMGATDPRM
jgi:hypothetical protein